MADNLQITAEADELFAAELRTFVGGVSDASTYEAVVDGTVIRLLTEAIGDRNPVYSDPAAAAASRLGRLVAPATMLMCWTVQARPLPLHAADLDGRAHFRLENARPVNGVAPSPDKEVTGIRAKLLSAGFVAPAVTNGWFEYHRYLEPGDRLTIGPISIEEVAGPKKTSLGTGFFITQSQRVFDSAGEVVAVVRMRMLTSRPTPRPEGEASAKPIRPAPQAEFSPVALWSTPVGPWAPRLETVGVGDKLPELVVELTPTQIIQGALASQDWAPVHHDRDIARSFGHPDIFMNIQTSTGFVGRLITDWAGSDAVIESLDIKLGVPNYAYDKMTMSGEVTKVETVEDRIRVSVAVQAVNSIGTHIVSNVVFTVMAEQRD